MTNLNLVGLLITLVLFLEFTKKSEHKNLTTMKGGNKKDKEDNKDDEEDNKDDEDETTDKKEGSSMGLMEYSLIALLLILLIIIGYLLYQYFMGDSSASEPGDGVDPVDATDVVASTASANTTIAAVDTETIRQDANVLLPSDASVPPGAGAGADATDVSPPAPPAPPAPAPPAAPVPPAEPEIFSSVDSQDNGNNVFDMAEAEQTMVGGTIAKLKSQLKSLKKIN